MKNVVVIGGGVIGVTTAAAIARRGIHVTLLERSSELCSGASARNGGQLSYAYSDALAAPGLVQDFPRLLLGMDPAFRIHIDWSSAFWSWLILFVRNCSRQRFEANTRAILNLALLSQSVLASLRMQYPELEFHHSATGKLHLYEDAVKWTSAVALAKKKIDWGLYQRVLAPEAALAMEPALAGSRRRLLGAIYTPSDEAGDAQLFTRALAELSVRQYGVIVHTDCIADVFECEGRRIKAVRTTRGLISGDAYVLAAGSDSRGLASAAGVKIPLVPMKGYSITLPATPSSPNVNVTDTAAKIVFCKLHDTVRIAGMAELGNSDISIDPHRIDQLIAAARASLPMAADWGAKPIFWAGLRPMTPDSRPIIGNTLFENLFLNCGHGMLGWTLACGSAELTAACMTRERLPVDNEFQLARFSTRSLPVR